MVVVDDMMLNIWCGDDQRHYFVNTRAMGQGNMGSNYWVYNLEVTSPNQHLFLVIVQKL
jgi:hypothetical protein